MNLVYSVSREFRWEAAHRICEGYDRKCSHNHGHSWCARITVRLRPDAELNTVGFVIDFDDLDRVGEWINDHWDHATLVADTDLPLLNFLQQQGQRHYVIQGNPTSERICQILFDKARQIIEDERVEVWEVWVRETCTSEARLRRTD